MIYRVTNSLRYQRLSEFKQISMSQITYISCDAINKNTVYDTDNLLSVHENRKKH